MKNIQLYISFLLCVIACSLVGQDNKTVLQSANQAFEAKQYDNAIAQYQEVLQSNEYSKALYNNLGSAYFQKSDIPHSILYFEKGLKHDPFDKSLLHNLSLAKEQLDNDIVQIPEFIITKVWKYLYTRASSNTWFILSLLSFFAAVYAFSLWLLHHNRSVKKKGFLYGIGLLLLGVLIFFLSTSQAAFQYKQISGIILQQDIALKSAPEAANEAILTLAAGTKVTVVDKIGEYEKVRLENGQMGWLQLGSYEKI